jgi:soluble lytic murein transglycosylase-like protein
MKKLLVALLLVLTCFVGFSKHRSNKKHHRKHSITRVHKKHKKHVRKHVRRKRIKRKSNNINVAGKVNEAILKYSAEYDVPVEIVYAVIYYETGYRGPDHKSYNHKRVSRCGAVGPMQIMPRGISKLVGYKVTRSSLLNNPDMNVKVGVKMLAMHYKRCKSWVKAIGAYNTGRLRANKYAYKVIRKSKTIEVNC